MSVVSFALAVVFIIRLFSTSAFRVPKSLNSLKIHDIYKLELAKLMHKFHYEMLPTSFKDLFHKTAEIHCHDTRYTTNQNYFIQQVSTNAGKKQFLIEEQHIGQV